MKPAGWEPPGFLRPSDGEGARSDGKPAALRVAPAGPATGEGKVIMEAIKTGDLVRLRDELRAAGVDEDLVRSIVSARSWKRYEGRYKALQPNQDSNEVWWKNDEDGNWGGQTKEQREQSRQLRAEQKAELESVLGRDPNASDNPWIARQYGFVAAERREDLQQLEQDYNELSSDLRRESRGFTLPSDQEKIRFLEDQKRQDLAALLTPEELEAYDLRQSRTAQNLRWRMTQMDATEAEFKTIFEFQKDFDDRFNEYDRFGNRVRELTPEDRKVRNDAEAAMKAELKEALGAERYASYIRSQDGDYQQLRNATKRFELPADTPNRVYDLRDSVPQAATRIADNTTMSAEEKKAALVTLAQQTRDQVRDMLGGEVAEAYFRNNGMQWVEQLERGVIITYGENGRQSHRRVEDAPRPAPAKPKP